MRTVQEDPTMVFRVRSATPEDAKALGELVKEFQAYLHALGDPSAIEYDVSTYLRDGFGPHPAYSVLVAEADGKILGYLSYYPGYEPDDTTHILHIIDLYVREGWRRQGVGRALMFKAAKICRQLGGTQLFWKVWDRNKPAFEFYESLGARYTKELTFMRLDV
jgi:GNAT superfamily N-acetyltransferase